MKWIFYRKTTSIMFVAALLVLVMLTCILLVMLTQMSALNQKAEELDALIQSVNGDVDALKQALKDREDIEYVIKWAEANRMINEKDVQWLKSALQGN